MRILLLLFISLTLWSCHPKEISHPIIKQTSDFDQALDLACQPLENLENILSIGVYYEGQTYEKYFHLAGPKTRNNIYSDTKSITSLLVGIAIDQGYINSVEDSIGDYLDLSSYDESDDLRAIKISDLLTMSSGLVWDSNNLSSEYFKLKNSHHAMDFILGRDLVFTPGSQFNYSDGSAHLMSIVFTHATGQSLKAFARDHLFDPLEIGYIQWNKDKQGHSYGGFDLHLNNQDMLKIGQLVLDQGQYKGQAIVSSEWIRHSTQAHIRSSSPAGHSQSYGYYWWLGSHRGHDLVAAFGHGGQFIYIIKDLNLVITASAYGAVEDSLAYEQFETIQNHILNDILILFE